MQFRGDFPAVFKLADGEDSQICIVYRNHCEYYGKNGMHKCTWNTESNGIQSFDPYHEIETCLYGNGFKMPGVDWDG